MQKASSQAQSFSKALFVSLVAASLLDFSGCEKSANPIAQPDARPDLSASAGNPDTHASAPLPMDSLGDTKVNVPTDLDARPPRVSASDAKLDLPPNSPNTDARVVVLDTRPDTVSPSDRSTIPNGDVGTGGWAQVTGGGDLAPTIATSLSELNSLASGSTPKVIHVSGKFSGKFNVGSNKTIIGLPGAQIKGGDVLSITSAKNVIVRNMTFIGTPDGGSNTTAVVVSSQHVWLDHCEFVDGGDGMLDIYGSTDFVTVSWCKMRYTGKTNHQAAVLMGVSNSDSSGKGKLSVTFHHNWWAENMSERQPRVRFGKVHVYNNLYTATLGWTYYAIRCGWQANVLSENNIFKDYKGIVPFDNGTKKGESLVFNYFDGSPDSVLETIGDVFVNCTERAIDGDGVEGGTFGKGTAFRPAYPYNLDHTDALEVAVRAGAGPTL